MSLSKALQGILADLLHRSEDTRRLDLDDVADAIGTVAVSPDDVEELFSRLEASGRRIESPPPGEAPGQILTLVIASARALTGATGRRPTVSEIALHTGLSEGAVRAALRFAQVMGR